MESFSHCHLFAFVLNFSFTLHVRFRVTSCFCFEFWRSIYNFDAFEDPCFENCNGLYRCFLLSSDECWSVLVWRASFKDFLVKNCFFNVFFEIPEFTVFLRDIFAHYLTQREVNTIWSNALRELNFAGTNFRGTFWTIFLRKKSSIPKNIWNLFDNPMVLKHLQWGVLAFKIFLTMNGIFHKKGSVNRLYLPRGGSGRGLFFSLRS